MPNVLTHIAIASEVLDNPSEKVLLGSALPDFVGLYNDYQANAENPPMRLSKMKLDVPIAQGVEIHYLTDNVFNGLSVVRGLVSQAKSELERIEGLSRGAAWAIGDPGTEILLDGVVAEFDNATDGFQAVCDYVLSEDLKILEDGRSSPLEDVARDFFGRGVPTRYQDPEQVAKIMHHRLASRGRQSVAFDESQIPAVAEVLDAQIARLRLVGGEILQQAAAGVQHELQVV